MEQAFGKTQSLVLPFDVALLEKKGFASQLKKKWSDNFEFHHICHRPLLGMIS